MHNYKQLRVYNLALDVVEAIYRITAEFPATERYALTDQLRRCSVSMPSNIAEGCGRNTDKSTANFVSYALGSSFEVETQLEIARRVGYGENADVTEQLGHLQRQLKAFHTLLLKS